MSQKVNSQRGGVEVFVKHKTKWPHEYVLAGNNKECVTYDQLTMDQWMACFCRAMREETNENSKDAMLDYLFSLMDDANDFSWNSAKASHAVLLCHMEQGEIRDYTQTEPIDRVRCALLVRIQLKMHQNIITVLWCASIITLVCLFVYLGFYVAFNTVQVISRWVVGRAEETST